MHNEGRQLTFEDVAGRVRRGARYMDMVDPGWADYGYLNKTIDPELGYVDWGLIDGKGFDLSQFDLGSCDRCVLGQRMSNYSDAVDVWAKALSDTRAFAYSTYVEADRAALRRARRLGFDVPDRPVVRTKTGVDSVYRRQIDSVIVRSLMQRLWEIEIQVRRDA